ncbi:hypothetical protein ABZP36_011832, partial [Zizania latifolia]
DPSLIDGEFVDKFDIIVLSSTPMKTKKSSKHIAFYDMECKVSCSEIFVDLQNHSYVHV